MGAGINRSSDQHHISFFENNLTQVIYTLREVNKISSGLRLATNGSVPALTDFAGAKDQLPPAIIYPEIVQFPDPNTNRAKNIIVSIIARSKRTGNKNIS